MRKTSAPREPMARSMPISCFLWEMLVAMKFESIMPANTAKPTPIQKNTLETLFRMLFTESSSKVAAF